MILINAFTGTKTPPQDTFPLTRKIEIKIRQVHPKHAPRNPTIDQSTIESVAIYTVFTSTTPADGIQGSAWRIWLSFPAAPSAARNLSFLWFFKDEVPKFAEGWI